MTPDEYAAQLATDLDIAQNTAPRSLQRHLGISDLGSCHAEALYKLRRTEPSDHVEGWQALFGTAVGDAVERARAARPHLLHQVPVVVTLPSGRQVPGTADEVDPHEPSVTDFKSKDGEAKLVWQRSQGATDQQRFQRHMCYLGAAQKGLVPLQGGIVRNAYVARSGKGAPLIEQEPFSMDVIHEADQWLSDVHYAAEHGEDASKDRHYSWCRDWCQYFTLCRDGDSVVTAMITDPELVAATRATREARDAAAAANLLEEGAKGVLEPLQRTAQGGLVAWETPDGDRGRYIWINDARKKAGGYWRLEVDKAAS